MTSAIANNTRYYIDKLSAINGNREQRHRQKRTDISKGQSIEDPIGADSQNIYVDIRPWFDTMFGHGSAMIQSCTTVATVGSFGRFWVSFRLDSFGLWASWEGIW